MEQEQVPHAADEPCSKLDFLHPPRQVLRLEDDDSGLVVFLVSAGAASPSIAPELARRPNTREVKRIEDELPVEVASRSRCDAGPRRPPIGSTELGNLLPSRHSAADGRSALERGEIRSPRGVRQLIPR